MRNNSLGSLPVVSLDFTPHQEVESLIAPAEFNVGLEGHRVVGLDEGIEELVCKDRNSCRKPFSEIVSLKEPGHGVLRAQAHDISG